MTKLVRLLIAVAPLALAGTAHATTYVGTRTIGTGSVNLSITTDNTIGTIGAANILSYTIQLFNLDGTFTLTQANSAKLITGGLSATASQLLFDFGSTGLALFQAPTTGSGATFYCLQGNASCYTPTNTPGEAVEATSDYVYPFVSRSGVQVIATAGAVPEPASWGMMIAGFGLIGGALRRRSNVRTGVRFA